MYNEIYEHISFFDRTSVEALMVCTDTKHLCIENDNCCLIHRWAYPLNA